MRCEERDRHRCWCTLYACLYAVLPHAGRGCPFTVNDDAMHDPCLSRICDRRRRQGYRLVLGDDVRRGGEHCLVETANTVAIPREVSHCVNSLTTRNLPYTHFAFAVFNRP